MDPLSHHEKIPFLVRSRQQQLDRLVGYLKFYKNGLNARNKTGNARDMLMHQRGTVRYKQNTHQVVYEPKFVLEKMNEMVGQTARKCETAENKRV